MSMTLEEAIKFADHAVNMTDIPEVKEFYRMCASALRPISREQVEKVWSGCQMCEGWNTIELKPCANGDLGVRADIGSAGQADPFGLVVYKNLLASGYVDFQFCPFCGSPKTADAVQMVMERLEALHEIPPTT